MNATEKLLFWVMVGVLLQIWLDPIGKVVELYYKLKERRNESG